MLYLTLYLQFSCLFAKQLQLLKLSIIPS